MDEESLEIAVANAKAKSVILISSVPPKLEQKEAALFDWYSRHKGNSLTKLRALFDFMAKLYGSIAQFTPCKKKCDSCCHYPVSITELEIQLIENETGIKRNKVVGPPADFSGRPCPFLHQGACSIYHVRPFVCRRHIVLTNTAYWCHPDRAFSADFTLMNFSEVNRVFNALVSEHGNARASDIRQIFTNREISL